MATPKGLTRRITKRQARSYQRLTPNGIGVTAISSVNGRGAYAKKKTLTYATASKKQIAAARARSTKKAHAAWASTKRAKRNRARAVPAFAPTRGKRAYGRNRVGGGHLPREPFRMVVGVEPRNQGMPYRRPVSTAQKLAERAEAGYARVARAGERVIDAARGGYTKAYQKAKQALGGRMRVKRIQGIPVIGVGAETVTKVRRRRRRAASTTERTMSTRKKRKSGKRRSAAQVRAFNKMRAGLAKWKRTHKGGRKTAPRRRKGHKISAAHLRKMKRGAKKWRLAQGYKGNKGKRKATRRKSPRRSAARRPRALTVKIGRRTARTYLYRKGKGVRHMPLWVSAGAKNAQEFARATSSTAHPLPKKYARIRSRVAAIMRARNRSAARVARGGDIFTPNRGRAIPFTTWSESMHRNKKKSRKRSKKSAARKRTGLTKHQIRVRAGRKAARTRKAKKLARSAARRKGGRKARKSTRRKMHKNRRRHARRFNENRRHRRARPNRRRHARRRTRRFEENRRRRRHARKYNDNRRRTRRVHRNRRRRSYLPVRVSRMHFEENFGMKANRRRRSRRSFRRNGDFWNRFKGMLKVGALAGIGFMGHRALSKLLSDQVLVKVPQLTTGAIAPYRSLISGLIVAAGGMFVVDKFAKKQATEVNSGIFVSLIQSLVVTVLTQMNQAPIAAALSAYPDAQGRAYRGYGEYLPVSGYGEYMPVSGFGALPTAARYGGRMLAQAAAGFGVVPMMTQAAAGYGATQMTQAAAGVGEYIAQNLEGIGDYEMVNGVGSPEMTDEGIRPDLASAEQALDIAEAAAGLGDIGSRSQLNPAMVTTPVSQSPGGMRAGVFNTTDGIFGK